MENVVLIIHLILALSLIGTVLLQRSEAGGGLLSGGGATGSRPPTTAMAKVTWALAIAFIVTSISLTLIAADKSAGASVIDRLGGTDVEVDGDDAPAPGSLGDSLLPPTAGDDPLLPAGD